MTISFPPSRAFSLRLLSRAHQFSVRVTLSSNCLPRVKSDLHRPLLYLRPLQTVLSDVGSPWSSRGYATNGPASRPGRPKAHTGRATASKRQRAPTQPTTGTSTISNDTSGVPKRSGPKTAAGKAKVGRKRKSNAKAKAKPDKRASRALTETQKAARAKKTASEKQKHLKNVALLKEPKRLPETAWTVIFAESQPKGTSAAERAKTAAEKYRSLRPEEHEHANHVANTNKEKNAAAYKQWVESFTPLQVKEANVARNVLRGRAKAAGRRKVYRHIKDDRLVKNTTSPYAFFLKERFESGDMKNMKLNEASPLIGREWKGLSVAEKKKFEDMAARDHTRYLTEYKTVYGVDAPILKGKQPVRT